MTNNDIFKKLRVALQLRNDQIVEILELVDFSISKGEIANFFRNADHPKYLECGDQILRNFLNGLVIHLRGTKEAPKNPMEVIKTHKSPALKVAAKKENAIQKPTQASAKKKPFNSQKAVVEKVRFNNGKKKANQ